MGCLFVSFHSRKIIRKVDMIVFYAENIFIAFLLKKVIPPPAFVGHVLANPKLFWILTPVKVEPILVSQNGASSCMTTTTR